MKKLLFITIISALLSAGCEKGNINEKPIDVPEVPAIEDYFSPAENTKYIYEGEGNEFASYTVYIDYINGNRIQTRTNNGGTEIVKVLELKDGRLTELMSRGDTYFRENFTDDEYTVGKILLKEPLEEDSGWSSADGSATYITSLSKKVVTPQGNIEAVEVTTESSQGTTIEYYAKDKGLVKTVNKGEGYEVSSTLSDIENNAPLIQTITLFYPAADGVNLNAVDIQVSFYTNDDPKNVIEKTIKDLSVSQLLSKNAKINELYYNEEENSAHIDLSEEFVTGMNAGAGFESLVLQSIANTLGTYYGVQNIYLTINGGAYESGHIILEKGQPLTVDYSNVKTSE